MAALLVTALAALALGFTGRRGGLATALTLVLALPVLIGAQVQRVETHIAAAPTTAWSPTVSSQNFSQDVGRVVIDLDALAADTPPLEGTSHYLTTEVGVGSVEVLVPEGVDLTVDATIGMGSVSSVPPSLVGGGAVGLQGQRSSGGFGINQRYELSRPLADGSTPTVVHLSVDLGIGDIRIQEK